MYKRPDYIILKNNPTTIECVRHNGRSSKSVLELSPAEFIEELDRWVGTYSSPIMISVEPAAKFIPASMREANTQEVSIRPSRRGHGIVKFVSGVITLTNPGERSWVFQCKKKEQLLEEFKNRFVGYLLGGDLV